MNQILSIENKNKKVKKNKTRNSNPTDIRKVMKIFAIIIILFAIIIAGIAIYNFTKNNGGVSKITDTKPTISVENVDDTHILISATDDKEILNITYQWNSASTQTVQGNGSNHVEQELKLPSGTNTLTIIATDSNQQTISYEKQYTANSRPDIALSVEGTTLKAVVTSEEELSYVTYRWDEEEETKQELNNETEMNLSIDIPQGLHTLTIIAVDVNNNTETKTQDVNGVTKPTLDITTDGDNFIIKATDKEALSSLEYIFNGQESSLNISGTEFEYTLPLQAGENKLEITVYNTNYASTERKVKFDK